MKRNEITKGEVILAGAGGGGVKSAGEALASAASLRYRYVTCVPFYSIAKRGGLSESTIIFSDEEIVGSVQQIGPCEKFYLGKKATGKLYDYLYKDATVSLKSKQAKYERLDSGAV